jgi:DNA polymerase I-like protein with 3'-5' exonuclease and polymerase domains
MKYAVIDTESTGAQRPSSGSALDSRNRLCYIGVSIMGSDCDQSCFPIEYDQVSSYGDTLSRVRDLLSGVHCLVLFNAKHDLHWLRRYGLYFPDKFIWDCQLAEFIIQGQTDPFPDLDTVSQKYGGPAKDKTVDKDYYSLGQDTDDVPASVLETYLLGDLRCTEAAFLGQVAYLKDKPKLKRLIWENCQDEHITQDMEWNGLKVDLEDFEEHAKRLESRIIQIDQELYTYIREDRINWDSPAQVSAALYGGEVEYPALEEYLFTYKDPNKPPKVKTRRSKQTVRFPRIIEPLPRSELASGNFRTDDKTLRKLKAVGAAKKVVELLLERRTTQTQISRYFRGIPQKYSEMGWEDSIIHGQLHHCVAATGRLSSSKPNIQNIDERARSCITTRFKT